MENFKIYYLSTSENPENIRYAGYTRKTIEKRLEQHLYASKTLKTHRDKWIQEQLTIGNTIITKLIEDNISIEEIDEREIFHIKLLKEQGFKLTNLTDGGSGNKNPSLETRQKISIKNKGKTPRKGAILSEETKDKIRQKRIGIKSSEETKEKIRIAGLNRKHSEETKIKMSKNNKRTTFGILYTDLRKEQMSKNATKKPVLQYSKDNIFISEFDGIVDASRKTNISKDSISKCCKGKTKSGGGYIWKYKNESDKISSHTATNIKKPVLQYSLDNVFIKEYRSITEAVKSTNGHKNHINECCKGKAMSSGGFIWKYKPQ